jgi:hypothetical protein
MAVLRGCFGINNLQRLGEHQLPEVSFGASPRNLASSAATMWLHQHGHNVATCISIAVQFDRPHHGRSTGASAPLGLDVTNGDAWAPMPIHMHPAMSVTRRYEIGSSQLLLRSRCNAAMKSVT